MKPGVWTIPSHKATLRGLAESPHTTVCLSPAEVEQAEAVTRYRTVVGLIEEACDRRDLTAATELTEEARRLQRDLSLDDLRGLGLDAAGADLGHAPAPGSCSSLDLDRERWLDEDDRDELDWQVWR